MTSAKIAERISSSSSLSGAPASPSTQQAPLHADKSQTNCFQKYQKKQFYPPPEPYNKDKETVCNNVSNMFIFATWQIMKMYLRK